MRTVLHADLPHFVAFGEALTHLGHLGQDQWRSRSAGAPWQLALAMSALDQLSAFAGAVSQDPFGAELWQRSQDAHLDMRFIQQLPRPPLLTVSHGSEPSHQFLIGQDSADLHFRPEGLPAGWTRALRCAHFGGLSLVRQPLAGRLLALAEGLKTEGRMISYAPHVDVLTVDSSYDDTLEQMCRLADVIQVSEGDLRGLFRVPDHRSALGQIAAWNPSAWLLLMQGSAAATLFHGAGDCSGRAVGADSAAGAIHAAQAAPAVPAVLAGLLDSLLRNPGPGCEPHLRWALAAGAAAVRSLAPPHRAEVAAQLSTVQVD